MPRVTQTPADLDAEGLHLWARYIGLRQDEYAAEAAYRAAHAALRRQPLTASPDDRTLLLQQYHDATATRAEVHETRQAAERAYRAYRRRMLVHARFSSSSRRTAAGTSIMGSESNQVARG
jgi:hypothetical protein